MTSPHKKNIFKFFKKDDDYESNSLLIPDYLKNSEVYISENWKKYEFDTLPIQDLNVNSENDYFKLIKTINFWKVETPYPDIIYDYIIEHKFRFNYYKLRNILKSDRKKNYFYDNLWNFGKSFNGNGIMTYISGNRIEGRHNNFNFSGSNGNSQWDYFDYLAVNDLLDLFLGAIS